MQEATTNLGLNFLLNYSHLLNHHVSDNEETRQWSLQQRHAAATHSNCFTTCVLCTDTNCAWILEGNASWCLLFDWKRRSWPVLYVARSTVVVPLQRHTHTCSTFTRTRRCTVNIDNVFHWYLLIYLHVYIYIRYIYIWLIICIMCCVVFKTDRNQYSESAHSSAFNEDLHYCLVKLGRIVVCQLDWAETCWNHLKPLFSTSATLLLSTRWYL